VVAAAERTSVVECHAAVSLVAEWLLGASLVAGWARVAPVGEVLIGTVPAHRTAVTSLAVTLMDVTLMDAIGAGTEVIGIIIGEIRTVDGVGGMVTGGVSQGITSYSSAVLAFRGGGVGAGALGQAEDGDIRMATVTVIMAMVIPTTAVAMVIPTMATVTAVMGMATDTALNTNRSTVSTAIAANPESPSCNGGWHELATTMDPLTEYSGRRLGAQSGITNNNTAT
jgi:hypothetical protein